MAEETLKIVLTADNKQAISAMKETVSSLDGVEKAAGKTGGGVKKLGTDFTGVSRVIQDLPFGFNAISNNLTQLLPAAGAAGLAFSALISGITFAQVGLTYWTRGIKEAEEALQASTKSVTDFNIKLVDVKASFQSARAGVLSKDEALKKYNDTLGSSIGYAKTMQEAEALMVKNTATVVQSINLRTQAQLYSAKAAELQAKISTGEVYNMSLMEQAVTGAKAALGGLGSIGGVAANEMGKRFQETNKSIEQFNKLSQDALTKAINLEKTLAGSRTAPDKSKTTGLPKESIDGKNLYYMEKMKELLPIFERFNAAKAKQGQQGTINLAPQRDTGVKDIQNLQLSVESNQTLNKALAERRTLQDILEKQIQESQAGKVTDYLMNSFSGLVTAMQNGANLGDALGSMFQKLAQDIAMAAAKALIFQTILSLLPVGGFAASGSGFVRGFGKLLGFAEGGTVSGPTTGYPVMLHGTEHIVRPDQMKSIIASAAQMGGSAGGRVVVEGRIQGQDIWLSQKRTNTFRALST